MSRESPKIAQITDRISELAKHADSVVVSVEPVVANVDRTVTNVNNTVDAVRDPLTKDLAELERTLHDARTLLASVQDVVRNNEGDVTETVRNLRITSENVRALTESLKQRPWSLVRTKQSRRSEGSSMKKLAAAVVGALVLAGCGSVRYPTSYLLNLPAPAPQAAPPQAVLGPVAVREFRCPEYLCEGRIVYRPSSGGSRVLRIPSLGDESAPGDHAIHGGRSSGAVAFQERRRSRTRYRGRVRADRQYRAAGRGGPGPRCPSRLHDIRATTGRSNRIRCLESHRIGSGSGRDNGTSQASSAVYRQPPGPPSIAWLRPSKPNSCRAKLSKQAAGIPPRRIVMNRFCLRITELWCTLMLPARMRRFRARTSNEFPPSD